MNKEVPQPTTATRSPGAGSRERSSVTRAAARTQSVGWVATSAARNPPPPTSEDDTWRVMGVLPEGRRHRGDDRLCSFRARVLMDTQRLKGGPSRGRRGGARKARVRTARTRG